MAKACKMVSSVVVSTAMNARGVAKFPINACVVYVGLTSGGDKILIVGPRYNRKGTLSGIPKTGTFLVQGPKIPRQFR